MVLQYVERHGRITRREAAELCRIGPYQASRLLDRLVKDERLCRYGVLKGTWYERRALNHHSPAIDRPRANTTALPRSQEGLSSWSRPAKETASSAGIPCAINEPNTSTLMWHFSYRMDASELGVTPLAASLSSVA